MYRACGYIDKPIPKHAISREEKYWKKIIENGGGGSAVLTSKDITENGLYNAADDEADGYSSVNVDVLNTYLLSDEGKVVSNGALVSQTSSTVSQNGVVDTTLIDSVNVNIPNINNILFAPPQKFKSNGSNLLDYKIYGNNTPHNYSATGTLPLTFTTHTAGNASDWEIEGNAQGVGELVNDHYEIPIYSYPSNLPQIKKDLIGAKVHETQVTIRKGNETLVWDVIGIDHDEAYYQDGTRAQHSVTLQLHDCYAALQFDAREALFAFPSGLAADTYHFTVGAQPWHAGDVNKTIQFTLAKAIPANGVLVVNNAYNATMIGATISSFASCATTTATETVTMSEGNGGTDLGTVNVSLNGDTNSIQRALLGSNNWLQSALRQWLNSNQVAGQVWTPQTKWDRPPSWVSNSNGFLNGLDESFVSALGKAKKITALNIATDGGGSWVSHEKVFLLSKTEVYGGNTNNIAEGVAYSYYSDYSDLSSAGAGADTNRIKYYNGTAQYWWLRSAVTMDSHNVIDIYPSGTVSSGGAYNASLIVPAVVIPMDEVYIYRFNIGNAPLTEGQSISKTSTGIDIAAMAGSNTISTDLYNKPSMSITGLDYVGVGEPINDSWQIPVKINSTTTDVPIDAPLVENEYVSYIDQKIYHYIDGTLTPVDPPSTLPHIATANGVNELSIDVEVQPELVGIGLGNPIELVNT